MATAALQLSFEGGIMEAIAQVAVLAGTVVLLLMLVGFGVFAYKNIRGDGIEWPDDKETTPGDDEVRRGDQDEEWDYY